MDVTLQNEILSLILLVFEENTEAKKQNTSLYHDSFVEHLTEANVDELLKTSSFLMFIKQLYTEEDICIISIIDVLTEEVSNEINYKLYDNHVSL